MESLGEETTNPKFWLWMPPTLEEKRVIQNTLKGPFLTTLVSLRKRRGKSSVLLYKLTVQVCELTDPFLVVPINHENKLLWEHLQSHSSCKGSLCLISALFIDFSMHFTQAWKFAYSSFVFVRVGTFLQRLFKMPIFISVCNCPLLVKDLRHNFGISGKNGRIICLSICTGIQEVWSRASDTVLGPVADIDSVTHMKKRQSLDHTTVVAILTFCVHTL